MTRKRTRAAAGVIGLAVAGVVSGCGAHGSAAPASTVYSTVVKTIGATTPSAAPTGALNTAPVTAASVASCGLLATASAESSIGMRLARVEALTQATSAAGCRFYALQGTALSQSEHLPGPNQPALEIDLVGYADQTSAHNAAVAAALAGSHQQVVTLTGGTQGDVFQTAFDPTDGNNDWVLVFSKGSTLVTVKTAISDTSLDAVEVANQVVAGVS